jgi:hypothetical protein
MKTKLHHCFILLALLAGIHQAAAQGTTAFTYQGQLHDNGTNANGAYTMIFALYNAASGGAQIGSTITTSPTLGNGLFTVNLDFGNAFNGSTRWLDITVTNGDVAQTLSPRVQILPSPYALYAAVAATVTNGAIANAQLSANAVNATNVASGQVVKSLNGLTDNVSLLAGNNLVLATNGNTLQFSGTAVPNGIQVFTSSGTFVVPAGITRIQVEAWGSGGGGGGSYSGTNGSFAGGGGGSGGYGIQYYNVTPGGSYSVTVGSSGNSSSSGNDSTPATAGSAGSASSFGGMLVVNGGGGGSGATSSANGTGGAKPSPASGSAFPAGVGGGGNGGIYSSGISIGGQGGSAFRGGTGAIGGPVGGFPYGHGGNSGEGADGSLGAGGGGGGIGGYGGGGGGGAVIITY